MSWFGEHLIAWYEDHGRAFPWRIARSPYRILVAERMLHRTQAIQVAGVYRLFLERYPDVPALAAAGPADVLSILAPLGLAWRFATFIPMARHLIDHHGGRGPATLEDLLTVPGVGPYTAAAVLAFAFDQPVAVVDTNTIRVAGRFLHAAQWVGDARKRRAVSGAVSRLLDPSRPATSNYALLDLGALVCVARTPLCPICPVARRCRYRQLASTVAIQPHSIDPLEEPHDE